MLRSRKSYHCAMTRACDRRLTCTSKKPCQCAVIPPSTTRTAGDSNGSSSRRDRRSCGQCDAVEERRCEAAVAARRLHETVSGHKQSLLSHGHEVHGNVEVFTRQRDVTSTVSEVPDLRQTRPESSIRPTQEYVSPVRHFHTAQYSNACTSLTRRSSPWLTQRQCRVGQGNEGRVVHASSK